MMLYTCPRISTSLVVSLVYVCLMRETVSTTQTPSIYQQTFSLLKSPSRGVKRLANGWTDKSVISCANSCTVKYQTCRSFMFNPDTGLCTPGSLYSDTEPLPNMAEGNFYHSFRCDVDKGFNVTIYRNVTACIGIFGPNMNYADADTFCRSKGAYLASVKTLDKLQILRQMRSRSKPIPSLWIGCDDLEKKRTYVWKDDGETFDLQKIPETFADGEPNYVSREEDCCLFSRSWDKLNDHPCYDRAGFATCEMPLP